ncbi:MAG: pyridoxal-phosphate dependent enzyme, partial [Trueperaceae bacterium]
MATHYLCRACQGRVPMSTTAWRCECGGPLDAPAGDGFSRGDIVNEIPSLWRYQAALWGVTPNRRMEFGAGLTPLVKRSWAGSDLEFKLDYTLASGSFKDRGAAVMMSHLASLGVTEVLEDSSGNGGSAIAAYAAAAGIRCHIFVPDSTSAGKVVQLTAFGAQVHRIPGSRQDTADAAAAASERYVYASHNWQPMFVEGVKTVAFELWEQRGFRALDAVVVPTSYGSNLLGLYRGFRELLLAGEIDRLPRLYAVQAAVVAPLDRYLREGVLAVESHATAAEGIAGTRPVRLAEMAEAVTESGGRVVTVEEDRIMPAQQALARETGLYVEPTSAVAAAAAHELVSSNEIG